MSLVQTKDLIRSRQRANAAAIPPSVERADDPTTTTRPPLIDVLLPFVPRSAYFHAIPAPMGVTIADGEAGWYIFKRFAVEVEQNAEALLQTVWIDSYPTDSVGGANANVPGKNLLPWGDELGNSAAIVVGLNLAPFAPLTWYSAPAHIPGIDYGLGFQSPAGDIVQESTPNYLARFQFPTGSIRDPRPERRREPWPFAPSAMKIRKYDTVDVALVVGKRHIHQLAAAGHFWGRACVDLTIALSENRYPFAAL